jgi:hypothetical protein
MLHRTRVSRATYARPLDKRVTVAVVAAGGTGYAVDDTVTLANGVVLTVATLAALLLSIALKCVRALPETPAVKWFHRHQRPSERRSSAS